MLGVIRRLKMEFWSNLIAIIGFHLGAVLLLISAYVLHDYQKSKGKVPMSFQFWMFTSEMNLLYPSASKVAKKLTISSLVLIGVFIVLRVGF